MSGTNDNGDQTRWLMKAYENIEFLKSPDARSVRVLCELVESEARLRRHHIRNTIVFFGSTRILPRQTAQKMLQDKKTGNHDRRTDQQIQEQAQRDLVMSRYYEDAVELARRLTEWSLAIPDPRRRFTICTGGGPGIMEAGNRGASLAGGESIGLNISLPFEQVPNPYQTRNISFEFHYFFIRKFWFFYLAKALVVFPGGFGTMDELFELLTLVQTRKTKKYMPIIIYGPEYWNEVFNFDALVKWGTISPEDLTLFQFFDDVDSTFEYLKAELLEHYVNPPEHGEGAHHP
ncbi:MAG: LOG family protein [Phycisphaerae bacterium]|nr:LOG family protein [Phycisphaerae bacterium]